MLILLLSRFYRLLLKLEIFLTWIIPQHLWTRQSTVMECRNGPWMMEVSWLWLLSFVDAVVCFKDGKCIFLCIEILYKMPCAVYSYLDCTVLLGIRINVKQFSVSSWPLGISKQAVSFKSWAMVVEGGKRICFSGLCWSPRMEYQVCTVPDSPYFLRAGNVWGQHYTSSFPFVTTVTAQELSCCQVLVALHMNSKEKRCLCKVVQGGRKPPVLA